MGGRPEYPEENLSEQGQNQQQTQPTYDTGSGNRTQATLVGEGGEGVGGRPEYREKNLSEQGENHQQTQPTCNAASGNRTWATLVGEGGRGWEEDRSTGRKTSRSKERTINKLNPHVTLRPGIEPGPHWWGRGGGGGRKTGVPGEKPPGARREPTTNSTHI